MADKEVLEGNSGFEIKILKNEFIQKGTGILMVHPDDYPKVSMPENKKDVCGYFVSDGLTGMNCKYCGHHISKHQL